MVSNRFLRDPPKVSKSSLSPSFPSTWVNLLSGVLRKTIYSVRNRFGVCKKLGCGRGSNSYRIFDRGDFATAVVLKSIVLKTDFFLGDSKCYVFSLETTILMFSGKD